MEILVALAIVVGVVGIVVPILPGVMLIAAAVGIWAVTEQVWWLLAVVILLAIGSTVAKFAIPARATHASASTAALAIGALGALVGFFVIPVVGAIVGFLVGVLATEAYRQRDLELAAQATWSSAKSIGLTMVVEMAAALIMAGLWVGALLFA